MKTTGLGKLGLRTAWLLLLGLTLFVGVLCGASPADDTAADRLRELRAEIARHDDLYFKQAKPEISDAAYDRLKRELRELETAHPELAAQASAVGDDRSGRFPTYRHREPMLSLDKAYTEAEWRAFYAKVTKQLGRTDLTFVIEPKYDGLAISLTYENGALTRAVTRGNGVEGDDVTVNVGVIAGLPKTLRTTSVAAPALVELRGEIYLDHAEFARLNAGRVAAGEEPFAHPRNLAAGTLKSNDPADTARRRLSAVIYGWGAWEGESAPVSQQHFHGIVRAWGLPGIEQYRVAHSVDDAWAAVQAFGHERTDLGFPIDGAVVKIDEVSLQRQLGSDAQAPRWAIACKYAPERVVTRLRAITLQVGRTGMLTPVAEFGPVELGGTTITRATLHNRDEIARRDLRVGDFIEVEKAGEIIPAVVGVQLAHRPADAKPYSFPARCPSCAAELATEAGEATVRCPNNLCPAQRQRRLEHFVSAAAVEIKGAGPATLAALIDAGLLQSPADFYRLRREDLLRVDGIGEKTADRLLAEIERSKRAELWRFIHGFSIPQIGVVNSRQLASLAGDLDGFAKLEKAPLVESVGPAAAGSVSDFLGQPENRAMIRAMSGAGVRPTGSATAGGNSELRDKVFVFTGTLPGLSRAQAAEKIRAVGGIVRDSVSARTDYVVAGEGAGEKLADARRLGVKVIDAGEFRRMVKGE